MSLSIIILLITTAVSIPAFKNQSLFYKYDFSPYDVENRKEWFRFITHAFLHADWWHLAVNMFVLFMFGGTTQYFFEAYLGTKGILYFLLLYFGGVMFAVLPTYKKHKHNPNYHSVGASGAISALVFSYVIFNPSSDLCLYGIICFPGIIWAVVYLIYSYQKGKSSGDNINHDAHFWGAIFGVVFTIISVPETIPAFVNQISQLLPF
jgi:membrane associated rhomboid family serine protease